MLDSVTILNSGCEIYDADDTIPSYTTIYGSGISNARTYAEKYNRTFIALDQKVSLGDVNGDGLVDADDASSILSEYSLLSTGKAATYNELQKIAADVNYDSLNDADDASAILSYYSYVSTGGTISLEAFLKK